MDDFDKAIITDEVAHALDSRANIFAGLYRVPDEWNSETLKDFCVFACEYYRQTNISFEEHEDQDRQTLKWLERKEIEARKAIPYLNNALKEIRKADKKYTLDCLRSPQKRAQEDLETAKKKLLIAQGDEKAAKDKKPRNVKTVTLKEKARIKAQENLGKAEKKIDEVVKTEQPSAEELIEHAICVYDSALKRADNKDEFLMFDTLPKDAPKQPGIRPGTRAGKYLGSAVNDLENLLLEILAIVNITEDAARARCMHWAFMQAGLPASSVGTFIQRIRTKRSD